MIYVLLELEVSQMTLFAIWNIRFEHLATRYTWVKRWKKSNAVTCSFIAISE